MLTLFKKVWKIYEPFHKAIIGIFFVLLLSIALDFVWPYVYGKTIDAVIRGEGFHAILVLLGIAFGVMVVQNFAAWTGGLLELAYFDYDSPTFVQNLSLKHLLSLSIGQHRSEHSALTQSVINDGQNGLNSVLNNLVYSVAPFGLRILVGLVVLFIFSWQIGLIVFGGVVISLFIIFVTNEKFLPFIREERNLDQEVEKHRMEVLRNAPLVISNSSESYMLARTKEENEKVNTFGKGFWKRYFHINFILRPSVQDLTIVSSIGMAAFLVSEGRIGPGLILTVGLWVNSTLSSLGSIANLQRQLLFQSERARKYVAVLDVVTDVYVSKNPILPESIKGEIVFKDVSFAYPKNRIIEDDKDKKKTTEEIEDDEKKPKEALEHVSLHIKSGEHVAFVGSSGAGKSTTILLLLRGSDPQTGSISVDGIDLKDIDLGFYRQNLGVVEQQIVLFDDTIRRNISFGLPNGEELSDEKLDEIAKISRIDEFKDKLTKGWDTIIGENGIKLSGGQRQRVGIARALAKDPAILILDEATSSLDAKNEALIKDALKDASRGRTTIMVAHRLSTVRDADRIFVFDKGTIVDVGKHEELLKSSKIYADLVSHQTVLL